MTLALILAILALLALFGVYRAARGSARALPRGENLDRALEAVDIEAFLVLVDGDDREFLRESLLPADFRKLQRQRARAALDYVGRIARNASLLLRLGESAQESLEPEIVEAGRELAALALRVRLNALTATGRLYLLLLFPSGTQPFGEVLFRYRSLTDAASRLSRLQRPLATAGGQSYL